MKVAVPAVIDPRFALIALRLVALIFAVPVLSYTILAEELPIAKVPSLLTVIPDPELTVWLTESITGFVDPAYKFDPLIVPAVTVPRVAVIALRDPTLSVAIKGATQVVRLVPGLYIPSISHRF